MAYKIKKFKVGNRVAIKKKYKPYEEELHYPSGKIRLTKPLKNGTIIKVAFNVKSNYVPVKFDEDEQYSLIEKKKLKVI